MIGRVRRQAMAAAQQAYAAASDGRDLIADMADGFGIELQLDDNAARTLAGMVVSGRGGKLPMRVVIDPRIDAEDKDDQRKTDHAG